MTNRSGNHITKGDWSAVVLILLLEAVFFRNILFSDGLLGDAVDGRLNTFFAEHWFRFITGQEHLTDVLSMFYPARNVLSFSDGMLLFGILGLPLRFFGVSMWTSFKVVLIVTHIFGSLTLYAYMRHCLGVGRFAALLSVVAFSYSNLYLAATYHVQLFAVSFLPLLFIVLHRPRQPVFAAVLLVLIFYTSFYIGFFALLLLGIYAVFFLLTTALSDKKYDTHRIREEHFRGFLFAILLAALLLIPFLKLYLPTMKLSGGKMWSEVVYSIPSPADLIYSAYPLSGDAGFSLPFVEIVLLFLFWLYRELHTRHFPTLRDNHRWIAVNAGLLTLFIAVLLCVRIDTYSLWYLLFRLIPGASAIRAVSRFLIASSLPAAVLLGVLADDFAAVPTRHVHGRHANIIRTQHPVTPFVILFAGILLYTETFSPTGVHSEWTIAGEKELLSYASQMPDDCETFYLHNPDWTVGNTMGNPDTNKTVFWGNQLKGQLDAVALSLYFNVPTMNGYSGNAPENWELSTTAPKAAARASRWADYAKLNRATIYEYDETANRWTRLDDAVEMLE